MMFTTENKTWAEREAEFDLLRADADWHYDLGGVSGFIKYWCGERNKKAQLEFCCKVAEYNGRTLSDNFELDWLNMSEFWSNGKQKMDITYGMIIKYLTECELDAWDDCLYTALNERMSRYYWYFDYEDDEIFKVVVSSYRVGSCQIYHPDLVTWNDNGEWHYVI